MGLVRFLAVLLVAIVLGGCHSHKTPTKTSTTATTSAVTSTTPTTVAPKPKPKAHKAKAKAKHHKSHAVKYVVKHGDTLSKISKRFHRKVGQIWRANPRAIHNPDLIYPRQRLTIPKFGAPSRPWPIHHHKARLTPRVHHSRPRVRPRARHHTTSRSYGYSVWDRIAQCESGGNWSINTGNGYYGGLQFSLSSWYAVGGSGLPSNASRSEQIARAIRLQAMQGWGAWPVCSRKAGLR